MGLSRKKVVMIVVGVIFSFLLLMLITYRTPSERVASILRRNGYTNNNDSSLYNKQISDFNYDQYAAKLNENLSAVYEENYFDVKKFQFMKVKMEYSDKIQTSFTPKYEYATKKMSYIYRVVVDDRSTIIFEGTFNPSKDSFVCENTYVYQFELSGNESVFCDKIEKNVKDFYLEMTSMIKDANLVYKMMKEEKKND